LRAESSKQLVSSPRKRSPTPAIGGVLKAEVLGETTQVRMSSITNPLVQVLVMQVLEEARLHK
jgi:hypothetical protein